MSFGFPLEGAGLLVGLVWLVVAGAFWALVIVGLILGVRWLIRSERNSRLQHPGSSAPPAPRPDLEAGHGTGPREDPLEVLRLRYARGEIDEEEFERRRQTLDRGSAGRT